MRNGATVRRPISARTSEESENNARSDSTGTDLPLGSTIECHAGSDPADVRKEGKLKEAGL